MEQSPGETGWRGSREAWLGAACKALRQSGIDAVRIMPLAKQLGLSRTSFYWFFKDRDELLAGMLGLWRDKNTGNLVRQANAYAETLVEGLLNVCDCWLDSSLFDSEFEFAVRSWALQSTAVQAEVMRADDLRLAALVALFRRFGHDAMSADVRARSVYLTQIGYISMQTSEDLALRLQRIPVYMQVFAGTPPEPREMDRFLARHRG